ncbi:GTP-binding protein LepA [Gaetbulibacter sp. 5U11]|nr:GTP-binding protein LepA [Gaetbulibacter sp. 5U11]
MSTKDQILKKIEILITNHFDTPKKAFDFFDNDGNNKLSKREIKNLLNEAKITGFIRGTIASKLIEGYDTDDDKLISWSEFKTAINQIQ